MNTSLPTPEQERDLHRRLLARDVTAPADLAIAYHEALILFLRQRNDSRIPVDLLHDAAAETWRSICKKPASFKGSGSLWSFLCHTAKCDLRNLLRAESERRKHFAAGKDVEELPDRGIDQTDAAENVEDAARARQAILPLVMDGLTDGERECLDLYLDGEKKTARFASALGISNLPKEEQEDAVKRTKDKLKVRLKRASRKTTEGP